MRYSYTPSYDYGSYGYSTPRYSTPSYTTSRSTPSYSTPRSSYSTPSYSTPRYSYGGGSTPITVRNPSYPQQQQQQQQQQQRTQLSSNVVTTTNSCVNNSCNTTRNTNNSINGSFNTSVAPVTPVSSYPVHYPVQYTLPQTTYTPTPTYQNTYCTITSSPGNVQNGQASHLNWTGYGATSAWLSDGIGMVAPTGTLAVRPNRSTTYTLTVSGFGGTRTCTAYVSVSGQYVALSQIPYTGFDFGTFGNAIYWMGLLSFAVAASYLVFYYRGGVSNFVPSILGARIHRSISVISGGGEAVATPEMFFSHSKVESKVESKVQHPVATFENIPANNISGVKDSMTIAHGKHGDAPRIVISRG